MSRSLEDLRAFVSGRGGRREGDERKLPAVHVIGAGKGGVGTSTLAALWALAAVERGGRVLLVEAEPSGLPLLFGLPPQMAGLASLNTNPVPLEALILEPVPGLHLLPAGADAAGEGFAREVAERRSLLGRIRSVADRYSLILLDAGSRADGVLSAVGVGASALHVVSGTDRGAAAGAYALVKLVHLRDPALPLTLLLNGAEGTAGEEAARTILEAVATFLGRRGVPTLLIPRIPELVTGDPTLATLRRVAAGAAGRGLSSLAPHPEEAPALHPEGASHPDDAPGMGDDDSTSDKISQSVGVSEDT